MRLRLPRYLTVVVAVTALAAFALPTQALRVMTYNILNYSSGRTTEFRMVLAATDPDVLVVEEILSQSAVNTFLNTVLEVTHPGEFVAGDFVNGPDTDNAIFYKADKVTYVGHHVISTTLRDIDEWTVRPVGYDDPASNIRIYTVHLKASQGSTNEQRRLQEVTAMRARMETFPSGQHYVVTGDFNIYRSTEAAYLYMLSPDNGAAGVVEDPIDTPGNWHSNSAFALIHTQSPRTEPFGGGATGGLDDRFDMLLSSPSLGDGNGLEVLSSTYTAYGQDGLHYNRAIIDPPENTAVGQAMAEALHDASDHLPVYATFQLPAILVADGALDFGVVIEGAIAEQTLLVTNGALEPADILDYSLQAPPGFDAPLGFFEAEPEEGPNAHIITMNTVTAGIKAGDLTIVSDAPDDPAFPVALSGAVLRHASPSTEPDAVVVNALIDFGSHEVGGFTDQTASVWNQGFDALQALLEVYDATQGGDPRFSIVGGFTPATVGDTPGAWTVRFDDTGATDGQYMGTLTFRSRDQQDLAGAIDLPDVTFDLLATVGVEVGVDILTAVPAVTAIGSVAPNPFRPYTTIGFGVSETGQLDIAIYDVSGRRIRRLTDGTQSAGFHHVVWDGRDDSGRQVGTGVYYVRLRTRSVSTMERVVRVR